MSESKDGRSLFADQAVDRLGDEVDALGGTRVLLVSDPARRHVDLAVAALGERPCAIFADARVHVPREVVDAARQALEEACADTVVTVGGGSATGLGKALRLERNDLRFVAVPTTYAGSEQTRIWGVRDGGDKRTGRDDAVRPDRVIYDPRLTRTLPRALTVQSLTNALAHPVSALSTGSLGSDEERDARRAVAATWDALLELTAEPDHLDARLQALRGAAQAAKVLDGGSLGVHHRVAHRLGGRFDLEHAALHAVLLPAFIDHLQHSHEDAFAAVREATRDPDPARTLFDLLVRAGAPTAIGNMGPGWEDVRAAIATDDAVPDEALSWVARAWIGDRPSSAHRRLDGFPADAPVVVVGPPLAQARRVVVTFHGSVHLYTRDFDFTLRPGFESGVC